MVLSKMFKKRAATVVLTLALATSLVAGSAMEASAALSGTLKVGGSTTVQPLAQLLANNFHKINKGVTITVEGGGSGVGLSKTLDGTFGLGMSSNVLGATDISNGLVGTAMARDALTFIVNPSNKVKALTGAQLKQIWTGQITNWNQLGGINHKIDVCGRAAGSGTGDFVNKTIFGSPTLVSTLKTYDSNGLLKAAVASDKNAIGYVGMAYATSKVRGLKVNGVLPTRANAKAGLYPYVRKLWWVTLGSPTGLAQAFINYSLTSKGQAAANSLYMSLN